jgi:hypothetical protein
MFKKLITIFSVIAFAYANAEVVKDEAYYIKKHIIIGTDTHEECVDGEGKILFNIRPLAKLNMRPASTYQN